MKRIFVIFAFAVFVMAQQSKEKIEFCGLGSSHDCRCIRKSQAVRQSGYETCDREHPERGKAFDACLASLPAHCDIVDNYRYDNHDENGEPVKDDGSEMGEHCSMICKMHDCKCDDGPTCHFGHDASAHAAETKPSKTTKSD